MQTSKSNLIKPSRFIKDTFIYGLDSIFAQLIALFVIPFYTKVLSTEEYGILAMATLGMNFITPLLSLGLDNGFFRYFSLSNNNEEKIELTTTVYILKIVPLLLFFLIFKYMYSFFNDTVFNGLLTYNNFIIILLITIINNIYNSAQVIIRASRKPKVLVIINVILAPIVTILSMYLVVILKYGVNGALISMLVGNFFKAIILNIYIKDYLSLKYFLNGKVKPLITYSLPYIPHRIQSGLMNLLPLFIINQKLGLEVAGIYAVAVKLSKPINLVVSMVWKSFIPHKFSIHKEDSKPERNFRVLIVNYWYLIIFLCYCAALISPYMYKLIIDEKFHFGISYFPFILLMPLSQAFYSTVSTGVEIGKSQKILPIASFLGLLVQLFLSIYSLKFLNIYGPIISFAIATSVSGLINYFYTKRFFYIDYPFLNVLFFFSILSIFIKINYHINNLLASAIFFALGFYILIMVILKFNNTSLKKLIQNYK